MKMLLLRTLLLLGVTLYSYGEEDINAKKQKILDRLLDPSRYDKRVRPRGTDGPTNITVTIFVLDVFDMDHHLKDFTVQCYLRQKWRDERLSLSKEDMLQGKSRVIRATETDRIWKPDLFFVNEIKSEMHNLMVPNTFLRISDEGDLLFSNRVSVILTCHTNLKVYPHDHQKCNMIIESYVYSQKDLTVSWGGDDAVGFSQTLSSNTKYSLLEHRMNTAVATVNNVTYARLYLEMHFARNFQTFFVTLYLPQFILVILSWAAFCIDHKNLTIRLVYLGLIIFLAIRLIPDSRDPDLSVTAMDIWIATCVTFVLSLFLESIFVNQVANREDNERANEQELEQQAMNSEHMTVEKEDKKTDDTKESKLFGNLTRKYRTFSKRVDALSRMAFPVTFLLFNIIYYSVCCTISKND